MSLLQARNNGSSSSGSLVARLRWIGVVSDEITESVSPTGTTVLEAVFEEQPSSLFRNFADVENWNWACKRMLLTGITPASQHQIGMGTPHPENARRLGLSTLIHTLVPLFQNDFKIVADPESLWRFEIHLNYRTGEKLDGQNLGPRKPPDRLHWEDRFNSYTDPNNNRAHMNTAGDWIKDIEETRDWLAFQYKWNSQTPPAWLHEYGNHIVNSDAVILDGDVFGPGTLCTSRPECRAVQANGGGWMRENELWVLHNPFGWKRRFPNVGFRERKLNPATLGQRATQVNDLAGYERVQEQFTPEYSRRWQQSFYMPARTLTRIATAYDGDDYVNDPAPLDKYGMAFRDWAAASNNSTKDWPLLDPIEPQQLILLEFRTKLFLPYAPMGLW